MLTLTTMQMKKAEKLTDKAGLTYLEMMRNAGVTSYKYLDERYEVYKKNCVIVCGDGNNAGDGFVLAKKMLENGANVSLVLCCGLPHTKESLTMFEKIDKLEVEIIPLQNNEELVRNKIDTAQMVVDAVFGTGFKGELPPNVGRLFAYINKSITIRIALDIPSGIEADTGECCQNAFEAEVTCCYMALKPAHTIPYSKNICGHIEVLDIGIPNDIISIVQSNVTLLMEDTIISILPKRNQYTHKGNYGKLLNICGSKNMCGAAMMATLSAMRIGAGVVTLATPKSVASSCCSNLMEAMTLPLEENSDGTCEKNAIETLKPALNNATACLIGCGLSVTPDVKQIVEFIINNTKCNLIFDADALNCISEDLSLLNTLQVPTVITPHIGEMARLSSLSVEQVNSNTIKVAKLFAREQNVIVVLKCHRTIIATPDGEIFQNTTGNAGLAKGGSGDVLAGMIAGLMAQGLEAKNAAICGVYLHGLCADRLDEKMSQYSFLARDLIEEIPYALKSIGR